MKRLAALGVALCLLLPASCTPWGSTAPDSFEILGEVELYPAERYDFPQTLFSLFPGSDHVALCRVEALDDPLVTLRVEEVLYGSLPLDSNLQARITSNAFMMPNASYLLFLQDGELYTLLTDNAGFLRLNGDLLYASSGGSITLDQARKLMEKIAHEVFAPSVFYYYSALEDLVHASDYVFVGTVTDQAPRQMTFFATSLGIEEEVATDATVFRVRAIRRLKGEFVGELGILLAPFMYQSTLSADNNQALSLTEEDRPPLESGAEYLFFLVRAPSGKSSEYAYFSSPFEGYVPIFNGHTLPVPTNAPFTRMFDVAELISQIEAVVQATYS